MPLIVVTQLCFCAYYFGCFLTNFGDKMLSLSENLFQFVVFLKNYQQKTLPSRKIEKRRKNRRPLLDLNGAETETPNLASSSQKYFLKNCDTTNRYLPIIPPSRLTHN
jgi:hypothetical protein